MTKRRILLFFLLIAPVLFIQLTKSARPFAGHFASYQLVMASMSRNILNENFTQLLTPKIDILTNGKRSLHLNQYPFPSVAAAAAKKILGGSFEFWGRFQAVACNVLSILLTGLIAAFFWGEAAAWFTVVLFAYSPYSIIYGQGFFSEPMSLLFLLLSLYLVLKKTSWAAIVLAAFCLSIAVAGRIHWALFCPLPALWILFFQQSPNKIGKFILFSAVSMALPAAWYAYTYWAGLNSDHVITNAFLQAGMKEVVDHSYLKDLEYYKRLLDTVAGTMLTPLVFVFLVLGLILEKDKKRAFFLWGGIIPAVFLVLLSPQKIMAHDFYLYPVFPFLCFAAGTGAWQALSRFDFFKITAWRIALIALYLIISARYFLHPVFKSEIDFTSLAAAAKAVQQVSKPDQPVIVISAEPAGLVYYADRPAFSLDLANIGAPLAGYLTNPKLTRIDTDDIKRQENVRKDPIAWLEYLHEKGGVYAVTPNKKEIQNTPLLGYLEARYQKLSKPEDDFYLFRLNS